jgi:hypothetical protein
VLASLFRFVPRAFGSREVERQAYIAVPVTLRTGWALASVLRGEVFIPQWHESARSSAFLRHLTLALLPELLAVLVFVSATQRTKWAILHAMRRSIRMGRTSRFSVLATGVGESSATRRQRMLSGLERDMLAGMSAEMSNPVSRRPNGEIVDEESAMDDESALQLADRRKLALVIVLSCLEGLEYPISPLERIAIRRRLDFFMLATPETFDSELNRIGWQGVTGLHVHRGSVIEILRRLLDTAPTDVRPTWQRRKTGVPVAVSMDLEALEVVKDTDSRGEFASPRISRLSGIRIRRLSGVSSRSNIH